MVRSIVGEKCYAFSLRIVRLHLFLCDNRQYIYSLSNQLLRAATSIGANVEEALGSHSRKEFSAKMSIAYKEARESKYWIRLLSDSQIIQPNLSQSLIKDIEEIIKISGSILRTLKQKQPAKKPT